MPTAEIEKIRSYSLFRDLAEDRFADLARSVTARRFFPYESLFDEGETPESLHLVLEGAVELYSRRGRREASIGVILPVAAFFIASTIFRLPVHASGRAIEPSLVAMLPAEMVRREFERDGVLARAVVVEITRSFRRMTTDLKAQRLCTSIERLANWILVQEGHHSQDGRFTLPYDKRTLAGHLGMTPENLSRNFAMLSDHGITVNRREVLISDREKLATFAEPAAGLGDWEF